jgi:hypothetical protein
LDAFDTDNTAFGSPRDLDRKLQLYFDGRNDYAEDDAAVLSGLSEATLMAWIKIDATAAGAQVLVGQDVFYLQLKADKKVEVYANGNVVSTITALNVNQWIHVAATYSSASGKLKLYINGELINSTNISGALSVDASHFTIGRKPDTNSNYFKGYFDEVRVFDKALSEDELHKMVYQEIENNVGMVRGSVIPRNVTDFINSTTINPLDWTFLKRYFRMDVYKDDIIDDLSTASTDISIGARINNMKVIDVQSAPLPFVTQIGDTTLDAAVDIPSKGVVGTDATTYDWSIVQIANKNITYNANQKHVGLIVNSLDASLNPIEFSIQNDSELNVSWYLLLNGVIDLDGESQLVQGEDSDLDTSSTGYIERDQQGVGSRYRYNDWSSPVVSDTALKTYTVASVLQDGTIPATPVSILFVSGYDGSVGTPLKIANYWIYKYANDAHDNYSKWNQIGSSGTLLAGEGYLMKGAGDSGSPDQNYVFVGMPNNGDITLKVNDNNDYLIGNPYPSALDADQFITDNAATISGTLYFWEHYGGESHLLREYQAGYATYNYSGGVSTAAIASPHPATDTSAGNGSLIPQKHIAVGQGFFVQGNGTLGVKDIVFKNSQRDFVTEVSTNSVFLKSSKVKKTADNVIDTRLKIRIGMESKATDHRQLLFTIDERASDGIDWGFDGEIYELLKDDMYWVIQDKKYVIQATNAISKTTEIPIGVKVTETGTVKIKIDFLENAEDKMELYLKDNFTGVSYNLNENAFEQALEAGTYNDRFYLTFKSDATLLVENLENLEEIDGLHIFMNNEAAELQIQKDKDITISEIKLVNYVGQHMKVWNQKLEDTTITLPIQVASGVYILQIKTQKGIINKKIIIG